MTRRRRTGPLSTLFASCAVLAACAGSPDASESETAAETSSPAEVTTSESRSSSTAPISSEPRSTKPVETTAEEPPGPTWIAAAQTGPLAETNELVGRTFSAGGMLWHVEGEYFNVLQGTADGENWVTLDFAAAGLPERAGLPVRSDCGADGVVTEDHGDGFTIVLNEPYPDDAPEYVIDRTFIVEVEGGQVAGVISTEGSPLEQLLHRADGKMFRSYCVGGITTVGDTRYLTGTGDWFVPGVTDAGDGFTATLTADGVWDYIVESGTPFGDGWHHHLERLTSIDGTLVALGIASLDGEVSDAGTSVDDDGDGHADRTSGGGFHAWLSADGHDWEPVQVMLSEEERVSRHQFAVGGAGLAALGAAQVEMEVEKVIVATSTDGRSWTTTMLTEEGQARGIVVDDDGFRVFGLDGRAPDTVSTMWTSTDGVTWDAEEIDLPTGLIADEFFPSVQVPVTPIGEGLVTVVRNQLYVSGLDWPAAG